MPVEHPDYLASMNFVFANTQQEEVFKIIYMNKIAKAKGGSNCLKTLAN